MDFRTKAFTVKAPSVYEPIGLRADLHAAFQAIASGASAADVITQKLANPLEVAAVLGFRGLESNAGLGVPLQTDRPLHEKSRPFLSTAFWGNQLPSARETAVLNLAAGLLQIYDFWEESHNAAQRADDLGERRISAQWHAICHRREPDAANANYWWARVGRNPLAEMLAKLVSESAKGQPPGVRQLAEKLIERSTFNDRAMVSQTLSVKEDSEESDFLRRLQKYEMLMLLDLTIDMLA